MNIAIEIDGGFLYFYYKKDPWLLKFTVIGKVWDHIFL